MSLPAAYACWGAAWCVTAYLAACMRQTAPPPLLLDACDAPLIFRSGAHQVFWTRSRASGYNLEGTDGDVARSVGLGRLSDALRFFFSVVVVFASDALRSSALPLVSISIDFWWWSDVAGERNHHVGSSIHQSVQHFSPS